MSAIANGYAIPTAEAAERQLAGSLILRPECRHGLPVSARDILNPQLRAIFVAVHKLADSGVAVDLVSLHEELNGSSLFRSPDESLHGFLAETALAVTTAANVKHYAAKVVEARKRRQLDGVGRWLIDSASRLPVEDIEADLRATLEDFQREAEGDGRVQQFTLADLQTKYPALHPPVVDGLLREGETANIISVSKVGKSWLAYDLATSIITGQPWLGRFPTARGKVLLIDNELHHATLANRIPRVGDAKGLVPDDYNRDLDIWPLRGNIRALQDLRSDIQAIEPGAYRAIILDAKYRFASPGVSENDNAAETMLYNLLDEYAAHTKAAFILVHHSSKGLQTEKRVTDVGSGAGAQSRAADCHMILREHEEEGVCVLDAAVRSFAPVKPMALRWNFPLWEPELDVDPQQLKGRLTKSEERTAERDQEGIKLIKAGLLNGPATVTELRKRTAGMSKNRVEKLLSKMEYAKEVTREETLVYGNKCWQYSLVESQEEGDSDGF